MSSLDDVVYVVMTDLTKQTILTDRMTRLCSIGSMIAALLVWYIAGHLQTQSFHTNLLATPEDMVVFWPYCVVTGGMCVVAMRYMRRQRHAIALVIVAIGLCVMVCGLFAVWVTYFDYYHGPRVPVPWLWILGIGMGLLWYWLYRHQRTHRSDRRMTTTREG